MIYIASQSKEGKKVSIQSIAEATRTPVHFIGKILQELGRKKFVKSLKGPNGGFYMSENEMQNSLADIVKSIDGNGLFVDCCLGLKKCSPTQPCPLHFDFTPIRNQIIDMLEKYTISDLDSNSVITYLKL